MFETAPWQAGSGYCPFCMEYSALYSFGDILYWVLKQEVKYAGELNPVM